MDDPNVTRRERAGSDNVDGNDILHGVESGAGGLLTPRPRQKTRASVIEPLERPSTTKELQCGDPRQIPETKT